MTGRHPKLSRGEFTRLVEQAIARIPVDLRRHLDNILISVQPRPDRQLLAEMGYGPDEELFGLFTGVPLTERSPADPPLYPDAIQIYQEPLEAYCRDRDELLEEIEITVVHEIAHYMGFDEDDLIALGYG